tara:strand:- start:1134 stop:1475 length:342 start_codon:yes stop_codon:yes gene_type:complete
MTKARREFRERHPNRNERIRREFWYEAEIVDRASRRKCVLSLACKYNLHPSRIYKIVGRKPTGRVLREDLLKELLPSLNALFGMEYEKPLQETKTVSLELENLTENVNDKTNL